MDMGALTRAAERLGLIIRESAPATAGQPMRSIIPDPRPATITDDLALSLDAVYRAVQVLQTAAGQLTIDVWRGPDRIDPPTWVANPDPWTTPAAWLQETVGSLALRGNAYWRVNRGPDDQIRSLTILDPIDVTVTATPAGIRTYHVGRDTLTSRDLMHLQLLRRPGHRNLYGLGPIQAARATIADAASMREYASTWTSPGTVPNGILSTDQDINADQAQAVKDRWLADVSRDEPMVLGRGITYEALSLKPEELQWLDAQKLSVLSIARIFGIPARLMLASPDGSSSTYANLQQEDLAFLRWTLMTYLGEIEHAITWLLPRSNTARFNVDGLLRSDTLTRYQAHQIGIQAGFLTITEVRDIEGLPPMSGEQQ